MLLSAEPGVKLVNILVYKGQPILLLINTVHNICYRKVVPYLVYSWQTIFKDCEVLVAFLY